MILVPLCVVIFLANNFLLSLQDTGSMFSHLNNALSGKNVNDIAEWFFILLLLCSPFIVGIAVVGFLCGVFWKWLVGNWGY